MRVPLPKQVDVQFRGAQNLWNAQKKLFKSRRTRERGRTVTMFDIHPLAARSQESVTEKILLKLEPIRNRLSGKTVYLKFNVNSNNVSLMFSISASIEFNAVLLFHFSKEPNVSKIALEELKPIFQKRVNIKAVYFILNFDLQSSRIPEILVTLAEELLSTNIDGLPIPSPPFKVHNYNSERVLLFVYSTKYYRYQMNVFYAHSLPLWDRLLPFSPNSLLNVKNMEKVTLIKPFCHSFQPFSISGSLRNVFLDFKTHCDNKFLSIAQVNTPFLISLALSRGDLSNKRYYEAFIKCLGKRIGWTNIPFGTCSDNTLKQLLHLHLMRNKVLFQIIFAETFGSTPLSNAVVCAIGDFMLLVDPTRFRTGGSPNYLLSYSVV